MKSPIKFIKVILVLGISLACVTTALYASLNHASVGAATVPKMELPVAYEHALAALGPATNQFYCVSASITTEFRYEGEWSFAFYPVNAKAAPKIIAVEFNGTVIIDNGRGTPAGN